MKIRKYLMGEFIEEADIDDNSLVGLLIRWQQGENTTKKLSQKLARTQKDINRLTTEVKHDAL